MGPWLVRVSMDDSLDKWLDINWSSPHPHGPFPQVESETKPLGFAHLPSRVSTEGAATGLQQLRLIPRQARF